MCQSVRQCAGSQHVRMQCVYVCVCVCLCVHTVSISEDGRVTGHMDHQQPKTESEAKSGKTKATRYGL